MSDRKTQLVAAVDAVRAASRVCIAVQRALVDADTLEKKDKSPVTVADFASQAIVCAKLAQALPGVRIVGEEDATELRAAEQATLRAAVGLHGNAVRQVQRAIGAETRALRRNGDVAARLAVEIFAGRRGELALHVDTQGFADVHILARYPQRHLILGLLLFGRLLFVRSMIRRRRFG